MRVCVHKTVFADDVAEGSSWQSKVWLFGHHSVKRKKRKKEKKKEEEKKRKEKILRQSSHPTHTPPE